ncbi:MAG: hypothetical protein ACKV2U_33995 [Bryobacteraceae bacterium]
MSVLRVPIAVAADRSAVVERLALLLTLSGTGSGELTGAELVGKEAA